MYRLFETIRIINGVAFNLTLHNERMNRSRKVLFGKNNPLNLEEYLKVTAEANMKITRCRVIYAESIISVDFTPYIPADIRTLKTVDAGALVYDHKFLDRSLLNSLIDKRVADDILIVRNGCVTDTSYTNIVFSDGERWITPDTPLLPGTMREYLIRNGTISQKRITVDDITHFTHFRLINAMLGFEAKVHPVNCIL